MPSLLMPSSFKASPADNGTRLVDFLRDRLECSARKAKGLLDRRAVLVNRKRVWMAKHTIRSGDLIEVLEDMEAGDEAPKPFTAKALYEDETLSVYSKPSGMLSNGKRSFEEHMVRQLQNPAFRVSHRLDADTSGCIICSHSAKAFDAVVQCFKKQTVQKMYQALVIGIPERKTFTIERKLDGQRAVTHVKILRAAKGYSLLEIEIETGRTHQIRRHLATLGHSVLGDKQYAGGGTLPEAVATVPRQMLHAKHLTFPHPISGKEISVDAPIPDDFRQWQKQLGLCKRPRS